MSVKSVFEDAFRDNFGADQGEVCNHNKLILKAFKYIS